MKQKQPQYKVYKVKEGLIVVSDEEIKVGDNYYNNDYRYIRKCTKISAK